MEKCADKIIADLWMWSTKYNETGVYISRVYPESSWTRWWFQTFFIFTPNPREMIQFDEHIFQMGGSTTN